jgi:hypothetical protein
VLAKLTSKNQLTLPKAVTDALGPVQYFEVLLQSGQILLTPVRIQRGDAVRAKLAELNLDEHKLADALEWAQQAGTPARKMPAGKTRSKAVGQAGKASKVVATKPAAGRRTARPA